MLCVRYDDGRSSENLDHCRDADNELRDYKIRGAWVEEKFGKYFGYFARCEKTTCKCQISDVEKPQIYIFASNFSSIKILILYQGFESDKMLGSEKITKKQIKKLNEAWSEMGKARHACYGASGINKLDREQKNIENHTFGKVRTELL